MTREVVVERREGDEAFVELAEIGVFFAGGIGRAAHRPVVVAAARVSALFVFFAVLLNGHRNDFYVRRFVEGGGGDVEIVKRGAVALVGENFFDDAKCKVGGFVELEFFRSIPVRRRCW